MRTIKNIKEVENMEIDGVDTKDYPDFTDAFIARAQWVDNGKDLDDDELMSISDDFPEIVNEIAFESLI